jgi:4a-hydroxytetrahydrobiopterin dehydratase
MEQLASRRCAACNAETPRVKKEEALALLAETPGFRLDSSATHIERTFEFKTFHETMAFVNAVAWIAHREDHHPDLQVSFGSCRVTYSTHAVGGLSENDFICAAQINALF